MFEDTLDKFKKLRNLKQNEAAAASIEKSKLRPYTKREVFIADGFELDPERAVLDHWKSTPHDGTQVSKINEQGEVDAGYGYGESVDIGGPYKARRICRPGIGEVKDIGSLEYWQQKGLASMGESTVGEGRAKWEPVPDNTPVRPPILPEAFPSDTAKARKLTAKALKKQPEEVTLADMIQHFSKASRAEVVKA